MATRLLKTSASNAKAIGHALAIAASAGALLIAGAAHAALQDRDLDANGEVDAFYDTDLDITWLRDANVTGMTNWPTASAWADGFSLAGYDDWRLPTSDSTRDGFNCTGSEMGHLWYVELGNPAGGPRTNQGGFQNLRYGSYWSGTQSPSTRAFVFDMANGWQGGYPQSGMLFAMAVRPGDVPAIPEPETAVLLFAGLSVLALARQRRPR